MSWFDFYHDRLNGSHIYFFSSCFFSFGVNCFRSTCQTFSLTYRFTDRKILLCCPMRAHTNCAHAHPYIHFEGLRAKHLVSQIPTAKDACSSLAFQFYGISICLAPFDIQNAEKLFFCWILLKMIWNTMILWITIKTKSKIYILAFFIYSASYNKFEYITRGIFLLFSSECHGRDINYPIVITIISRRRHLLRLRHHTFTLWLWL